MHGKLHILGIGAALKILLLPEDKLHVSISREEVVAFFNTLSKFRESIQVARELFDLYSENKGKTELTEAINQTREILRTKKSLNVGEIRNLQEFSERSRRYIVKNNAKLSAASPASMNADVVVVGSGLAGLTTTLTALDRGATVVLIEKESRLGGNSGKASSGINAAVPETPQNQTTGGVSQAIEVTAGGSLHKYKADDFNEEEEVFYKDIMKSGGGRSVSERVSVLVKESRAAIEWLREQGLDLSSKAKLGGHSVARTHRPSRGMIGAEVIFTLEKKIRAYQDSSRLTIVTGARVESLIIETNVSSPFPEVLGVKAMQNGRILRFYGEVVLATGGFGHDHSANSYLYQVRPDLRGMPTTLGEWTTGDGLRLAESLPGTRLADMEMVILLLLFLYIHGKYVLNISVHLIAIVFQIFRVIILVL